MTPLSWLMLLFWIACGLCAIGVGPIICDIWRESAKAAKSRSAAPAREGE